MKFFFFLKCALTLENYTYPLSSSWLSERAEGWSWLLEVSGSPCTPSAGFWRDGKRLQLKLHLFIEIMIVANGEWENDENNCRHGIGLYLKKTDKNLCRLKNWSAVMSKHSEQPL